MIYKASKNKNTNSNLNQICEIGNRVYLIDDCGDGELIIGNDVITAILIEENQISVKCKKTFNEFWIVGQNAFLTLKDAKEKIIKSLKENKV